MIISDFNGNTRRVVDDEYFENIKFQRNSKEPNKLFHEINVTGYYSKKFKDAQTEKGFTDIIHGHGKLLFVGNWDEYDKYIDWLIENEGKLGIKII